MAEIIHVDDDMEIYTSGATNIFKYPELSDGAKASQLIGTLEQKDLWREILTEDDADSDKKNEIQSTSEVRHRCSR